MVLWRLAIKALCADLERLFGRHGSQQLEKIFGAIQNFLDKHGHLLTDELPSQFIATNAALYTEAVNPKSLSPSRCIGFIDEAVIRIARAKKRYMI